MLRNHNGRRLIRDFQRRRPNGGPSGLVLVQTTILMAVNRCICRGVSFADALTLARLHGCANVGELQAYVDIGSGCGLCIPYMQRSLMTGQSDLPVMGEAEATALRNLSGVFGEGGRV